jgi:predicted Rossmann-fold nucleotide-binding protein
MNIQDIQNKGNARKYFSIFGKSTVANQSREYQFTEEVTKSLIENDFGVIHGGYAGGIMQAVADTAYNTIKENGLPFERNIAVPQVQHDATGWDRVENAFFVEPAKDIYSRLRDVSGHSDIAIVAPLGGDGTMLELNIVWHENVLAKYTGDTVVPIIILQTENGTDWKNILETLVIGLDNSTNSLDEIEWVYFASNINEFNDLVERLN